MPRRDRQHHPQISCERSFLSSPQCAHVTVTPEESRISVLSAGMPHRAHRRELFRDARARDRPARLEVRAR